MIFKYGPYIFTVSLLFPLGKVHGTSFGKNCIPFTQRCFAQSLVEIGPGRSQLIIKIFDQKCNEGGDIFLDCINFCSFQPKQGPLGDGDLEFHNLCSLSPIMLHTKLVKIGTTVLEEMLKMFKC